MPDTRDVRVFDLSRVTNTLSQAWQTLTRLPRPVLEPGATAQPAIPERAAEAQAATVQVQAAGQTVAGGGSTTTLGERDFGPLQPLQPRYGPDSPEVKGGPRQFQYPVGSNIIVFPRQDYPDLTPFDQLRNLATSYDVSSMCIGVRIEQVQGMGWSIVAKDKRKQRDYAEACEEATKFFRKPDGVNPFETWVGMAIREHLVTDALSVYPQKSRGGRLLGLQIIDGTSLKPLIDDRGITRAYQQVLYGYPFSQYNRSTVPEDERLPIFAPYELMYLPRFPSVYSPYGSPPTEWIIIRVNQALRKQLSDLAYWTEGNIPEMIASLGSDNVTLDAEKVEEFESYFNDLLAGNIAARRRIKFIPWQAQLQELRPFSHDPTLDEWMLRVTCAAYSVPPQELGFTDDVNRATAELQEAVNERRGLKPLVTWLKTAILDEAIQNWFEVKPRNGKAISLPGTPTRPVVSPFSQIEWSWSFGDKVDMQVQANTDQTYISAGVLDKNEVRAMRFGGVVEGDAPLSEEEKAALKDQQAATEEAPAGGAPPAQGGQGQAAEAAGGAAEAGGAEEAGAAGGAAGEAEAAGGAETPAPPEVERIAASELRKTLAYLAGRDAVPSADLEKRSEDFLQDDDLDLQPGDRDAIENRLHRVLRTRMDYWMGRLAQAAVLGRSMSSQYDNLVGDLRAILRKELDDIEEEYRRRQPIEPDPWTSLRSDIRPLRRKAMADDMRDRRDEFESELFRGLVDVVMPLGSFAKVGSRRRVRLDDALDKVFEAALPTMADRAMLDVPAALTDDLAELGGYSTFVDRMDLTLDAAIKTAKRNTLAALVGHAEPPAIWKALYDMARAEATRIYNLPHAVAVETANEFLAKAKRKPLNMFGGGQAEQEPRTPKGGARSLDMFSGGEAESGTAGRGKPKANAPTFGMMPGERETRPRATRDSAKPRLVLVPPLHPHCRCGLRSFRSGDQWLTVWWTKHIDACKNKWTVPWGQVDGCIGLKGRVVTSGEYLGRKMR